MFMQAVHSGFIHLAFADNGKHEHANAAQYQSHGRNPFSLSARPGASDGLYIDGTLVYELAHYLKLMLDNNNVTELLLCDGFEGGAGLDFDTRQALMA
jgi:hypothetical protein